MSKISNLTGTICLNCLIKENITIPHYQRPYVWDTERVKILLEDLDEYLQIDTKQDKNKPKKYLLGSLIIYYNDNKNEFEVVDGQQRLVSLALILLCLEKLEKGENATIEFLKDSKFTHNESKVHINQNYKYIQSWFSSKKGWKIENNANYKKYIRHYKRLLKIKLEFIYVKAPSLDDAFIFFDSANAKGARLKAYDLVKAFHLRALDSQNCKDLIKFYAKDFESLASKNSDDKNPPIKVLFNDILAPARIWLRDRGSLANATHSTIASPQESHIYNEFCKEFSATLQTKSQLSTNSLGILQNFIGGADFFEFLAHFNRLYEKLLLTEFYENKIASIDETGFAYNRLIYIMAMMIYFDKFQNGNADYMLRLIARAVFSLRVEQSRVGEATIKKYVKEEKLLSLIYFTSYEKELENELKKFINDRKDKEDSNDKRTEATKEYIAKVQNVDENDNYKKTEYGRYDIMPHPKSKDKWSK